MADILPPVPYDVPQTSYEWVDWYERLRKTINTTDLNHNDLKNIQGGNATERYHLTQTQHSQLTGGGSTTLHSHPGSGEAFPVGSIYISVSSTNPATTLGYGTWTAFATGRFLVAIDSGDSDFTPVEKTGGSKTATI